MAEFLHFFKGKLTNCSLTFIALFFLGFVSAQTVPTVSETVESDGNGNVDQFAAWLASHGGASAPDACSDVAWSYVQNVCGSDFVDRLLTSEDDFSGNATFINFDDLTAGTFVGNEYADKGIVFSTTSPGMSIAVPNVGPCTYPISYSGPNHFGNFPTDCSKPNGSLTLNFTNGINRVGFRAASNYLDDFKIEVSCLSKGYVVGVKSYTATGPDSYQFVGIESSIPFDQLVITIVDHVNGSIALDDLRFETCDASAEPDEQLCSISTQYFFIAKDNCGKASVTKGTFTIEDTTAPSNITISAPLGPVQIGFDVPLTATYTDANPVSAIWYFSSDGITYEYSKAGVIDGTTIKFNNTVPKIPANVYTIKLVVKDACNNSSEIIHTVSETVQTQYLVIYDPAGGFVTGGGWINSPVNPAYSYMQVTGKANFGFNAKYKTGKNNTSEVDGNTNFQFKDGGLNFKSSSHDNISLVISGAKATYKGVGTVNGSGNHKFMVTAMDGDLIGKTDKFRIKIWENGSSSSVIYDNEYNAAEIADATTEIGGGSIVIHKPKGNGKEQEEPLVKTTPIIMQEMNPEILESLAASPNPVVSFSTVRFSLKEDANVALQVYDYSGRMIETLYNGQVKAYQNYNVDFQRKNLMSGIYIVKLTTDKGQSYDKRIIVE
jgi:hypothetical protein